MSLKSEYITMDGESTSEITNSQLETSEDVAPTDQLQKMVVNGRYYELLKFQGTSEITNSQLETSEDVAPTDQLQKTVVHGRYYELLKFQDLPDHLKINEYILTRYRSYLPLKQAFCSLFAIHNETVNIWTHLVGFFIFLALTYTTYIVVHLPTMVDSSNITNSEKLHKAWQKNITNLVAPFSPMQSHITRWPFIIFLGGAMSCFLFSTTFHLLNCRSKIWFTLLQQLDHASIAILIVASFYPPIYYTFICYPMLRNTYLFGITILGALAILFSSFPMFRTPEFRPIRTLFFFCMGFSGVVPSVHKQILFKNEPSIFNTLSYDLGMASLYGVGAFLYATRIPERLKPGTFDIVGNSHQIFHILVVVGAYTHYKAGLIYLVWRDTIGCP